MNSYLENLVDLLREFCLRKTKVKHKVQAGEKIKTLLDEHAAEIYDELQRHRLWVKCVKEVLDEKCGESWGAEVEEKMSQHGTTWRDEICMPGSHD